VSDHVEIGNGPTDRPQDFLGGSYKHPLIKAMNAPDRKLLGPVNSINNSWIIFWDRLSVPFLTVFGVENGKGESDKKKPQSNP
jgi:hypothetical protein